MKYLLLTLTCLLTSLTGFAQELAVGGEGPGNPAIIDQVIARIGGEYILLSELEEQFALAASQSNEPVPPEARCQLMDQLLVSKLLYNQSKLDSVIVSDSDVETQLNARIDRILSYMNGDLQQFEDYYGQTITAVKEQFREDLREQLAVERIRGTVVAGVKVTPREVKNFFAEIPQDSLPYFSSEVEVGEIVRQPVANDSTKAATVAQLEEIRQMIVDSTLAFEDAARRFSQDGSARGGGDLGWTKRGKFVPEFEAAAYNLEPGEVSEVVESEFGYHLIKQVGRRGNSIRVSHILIRPEITEADIALVHADLDSIRTLILADTMSFSRAVKLRGFDKVQSYNNDGRMTNPASGNTCFEIGDLDPDVYFAIDELPVGGITEPMDYRGPSGDPLVRILQLQSRTSPHRATLAQDYSRIQTATESSKQQEYLNEWIAEKVSATYVEIDERYHACPNLREWLQESRKLTVGGKAGKVMGSRK